MTYSELLMKLILFIPILLVGVASIVPNKVCRDTICILLFNCLIILFIAAMLLIFDRSTLLTIPYFVTILGSILTIFVTHDDRKISKVTRLIIARVCAGLIVVSSAIAIFFDI